MNVQLGINDIVFVKKEFNYNHIIKKYKQKINQQKFM
jgi:hypothetical protein